MLASTVRVTRDLDLAEECVQDAYAQALTRWAVAGLPRSPGAWLTTVARRRAVDLMRRETSLSRKLPLLIDRGVEAGAAERDDFGDDRLRLVFTCCHPALSLGSQVALTLRLLCGLSTVEVAHSFLVSESTMAARVTRAKRKIATAGIPYRVPAKADLPERIEAVLTVVQLLFTTGHTAPAGAELVRHDLVDRAIELARMLRLLLPADPGVAGLLATFLLTDARRATRVGADGRLLLLSEQDRSQWDQVQLADGAKFAREALRQQPPGRYALMAAVAAVHARAPTWEQTDWAEIITWYDLLLAGWPSPVVALNRAVAIGFGRGPAAGLVELDQLSGEPRLAAYCYLPAARADFLAKLGHLTQARQAYDEARLLTANDVERAFLTQRLNELASRAQ